MVESFYVAVSFSEEQQVDLMIVDYRLREEKTVSEAIHLLRKTFNKNIPAIITCDTSVDPLREAQASDAVLLT